MNRNDRRLTQHNTLSFDINEGIGGTQINGQIIGKLPQDEIKQHRVILLNSH
jgi:hypothetical protein